MARKKPKSPPKIATRDDVIDWPDGADLLELAELHYPDGPATRQRWWLKRLEAALDARLPDGQRLVPIGARTVRRPAATMLELGLANDEAFPNRDDDDRLIRRTLPVIGREDYVRWWRAQPDRPPVPHDSPLTAWLGEPADNAAPVPPRPLNPQRRSSMRKIIAALEHMAQVKPDPRLADTEDALRARIAELVERAGLDMAEPYTTARVIIDQATLAGLSIPQDRETIVRYLPKG